MNWIVFQVLKKTLNESFTHTAFTFGFEAGVNKSPIDGNLVPPAALVKLMQKGLQYMEMEANLSNAKNDVDEDFSFLQPMDLITKDVYEMQKIVKDKKKDGGKELDKENEGAHCRVKDKARKDREKQDMEREGKDRDEKGTKRIRKQQEVQNN
ncbi:hypothetical protein Pfo_008632 [Paulownia fortunei]|nr:hypothetical protein Pfo_008632 [Paulownia fortunei]